MHSGSPAGNQAAHSREDLESRGSGLVRAGCAPEHDAPLPLSTPTQGSVSPHPRRRAPGRCRHAPSTERVAPASQAPGAAAHRNGNESAERDADLSVLEVQRQPEDIDEQRVDERGAAAE